MVKAEGLDVFAERKKVLDLKPKENYQFVGCEQTEQIDTDAVYKRVNAEMDKIMEALTSPELYERNRIKANPHKDSFCCQLCYECL